MGSNLYRELRVRIKNQYFQPNAISIKANAAMVTKTVVWLGAFVGLYLFYVLYRPLGVLLIINTGLLGAALIGIAFNIMHDANHGAYSRKKVVNAILGYTMNVPLGLSSAGWKVQHNVDHHNETNIYGHDGDIEGHGVLRFSPEERYKKIHRYQHIYAWFFYAISTLTWVFRGDFVKFYAYCRREKIKPERVVREWIILIVSKIVHVGLFIAVPILAGYVWWIPIVVFISMHMLVGLVTTVVFQLAHVVPSTEMLREKNISIETNGKYSFLLHQLQTTANFGVKSKVLSWLIGGLNFQTEHHLFRDICHIHYPKIALIVKQFCEENALPYHNSGTLWQAIVAHYFQLKYLSRGV